MKQWRMHIATINDEQSIIGESIEYHKYVYLI